MPLGTFTILIFIGIAVTLFVIMYFFVPRKTFLQKRVESLAEDAKRVSEGTAFKKPVSPWQRFLEGIGRKVPLRPKDYGKYRKALTAAGLPPEALPAFLGSKALLAGVFPLIYLLFYLPFAIQTGRSLSMALFFSVALAAIGFLAPTFWLSNRAKKRKLLIFQDLPDTLDIMTVCVEAGLSVDASMIRIYEDKQFEKSPLSREMRIAVQETRAGKPRYESLRDMGERSGVEDLKSLAAMLVQTEKLGTSLADSLRIHSDSLRTKRRQKAEEEAAKTTIKLIFPLVFLFLPAMFVVILLPAVIRLSKFLSGL